MVEFDPQLANVSATCVTASCPNEGKSFDVVATTNADSIFRVYCALCSQPMSVVVP